MLGWRQVDRKEIRTYNGIMGHKLVKPDESGHSIVTREVAALPVLPREEAIRVRKAGRGYADAMLPLFIQAMARKALEAESEAIQMDALKFMIKLSLGVSKSNEDLDPAPTDAVGVVVDGKDPVDLLEKETENVGSGQGE